MYINRIIRSAYATLANTAINLKANRIKKNSTLSEPNPVKSNSAITNQNKNQPINDERNKKSGNNLDINV
jgi:hypothetical protein